jgi:hypothetical protein
VPGAGAPPREQLTLDWAADVASQAGRPAASFRASCAGPRQNPVEAIRSCACG